MLGLALLIFIAETSVVTLDTLRIIFVGRGLRLLASATGFIVVCIWLFAIGQIMKNLGSWECYVAYALGYTLGNYLGVSIEELLAMGMRLIRIITNKDATPLLRKLREANHGVTSVPANGANGPVHLIFTIVQRKHQASVLKLIHQFDPHTFYTVEDVRKQAAGVHSPGHKGRPAAESLGAPVDAAASLLPTRQAAA
jgi:uncharacterized protein YebE (UPF0316 family)